MCHVSLIILVGEFVFCVSENLKVEKYTSLWVGWSSWSEMLKNKRGDLIAGEVI
jgi:hypothetical protein